ncbi:hypothetical protein V1515DRAFT_136832 [Lipomyces mesembrius]
MPQCTQFKMVEFARKKEVKLLVDAEQTYMQRAIDDVSRYACSKVNSIPLPRPVDGSISKQVPSSSFSTPSIFNTYQMYLVDARFRMEQDLLRSRRFKFGLGFKTVRGAYMHQEKQDSLQWMKTLEK